MQFALIKQSINGACKFLEEEACLTSKATDAPWTLGFAYSDEISIKFAMSCYAPVILANDGFLSRI